MSGSGVVDLDGVGEVGSQGVVGGREGRVHVGGSGGGALVWAVSMAKQERTRVAWRLARKDALRRATAWYVESKRRARDEEEA